MRNKIKDFFNIENKIIIITTIFSWLVAHLAFLTNKIIIPSTLSAGNISISGEEVALGRWLISFFQNFRFGIVSKNIVYLIGLILIIATIMIITKIFKVKNKILICLISILVTVSPVICEMLMHVNYADIYFLGVFLSILSVHLLIKEKNIYKILAIICIIAALAIHQSQIMLVISLLIFKYIIELLNMNSANDIKNEKEGFKQFGYIIIAVCIYCIITLTIMSINDLKMFQNFSFTQMLKNIPNTYVNFYNYMFNDDIINNVVWNRHIINFIILLFTVINLILIALKNKLSKKKIVIIAVCILILSFTTNFLCIVDSLETNSLIMTIQYILIYIFSLKLLELLDKNKFANISTIIIVLANIYLVFTFVYSNNATYITKDLLYKNYYSTCLKIMNNIQEKYIYHEDIPIIFGGVIKNTPDTLKLSNSSRINNQITYPTYQGVEQIKLFYRKYLGMNVNLPDMNTYLNIINSEDFKSMPVYPNYGSINLINGYIVVKLENNPPIY